MMWLQGDQWGDQQPHFNITSDWEVFLLFPFCWHYVNAAFVQDCFVDDTIPGSHCSGPLAKKYCSIQLQPCPNSELEVPSAAWVWRLIVPQQCNCLAVPFQKLPSNASDKCALPSPSHEGSDAWILLGPAYPRIQGQQPLSRNGVPFHFCFPLKVVAPELGHSWGVNHNLSFLDGDQMDIYVNVWAVKIGRIGFLDYLRSPPSLTSVQMSIHDQLY